MMDLCRRSSTTTTMPLLRGVSEDVILHRCRCELHRGGKLAEAQGLRRRRLRVRDAGEDTIFMIK
ncbi:hypothetical protein KSP40_PGU007049 [Platanthera guangdongensis]|uniref:Uncharacterized protein n=1 Tax=Platanthera guangdongensis TaxID=2320717 RepID=A0ABR2LZI2_9ASPA